MKKKHDKDEPLNFILFPNPKKNNRSQPDWVGKIVLEDGTIMRLAGWNNKMTNVEGNFIGGKMSKFETKEEVAARKAQESEGESVDTSDLPF